MIRTVLAQVNWGVDPLPDGGVQFNFFHQESQNVWHVPFSAEALVELLQKLGETMPDEVKAQVRDHFQTNGIALPGRDFDPSQVRHQDGPQG